MAGNSSCCTVNFLDCATALRKTEPEPPYIAVTDPHCAKQRLAKWETVPPLLELTSEALVVNNWQPLIELLLDQISSGPIYSTLLARALFHSKEQIVHIIFTKWPWKKMIFLGCPLSLQINSELDIVIYMLTNVYAKAAKNGSLKSLRYVDVSFAHRGANLIEEVQQIMGNVEVTAELYDPANLCQTSDKINNKQNYVLHIHEDVLTARNCMVELFIGPDLNIMQKNLVAEEIPIIISDRYVLQTKLHDENYEFVVVPSCASRFIQGDPSEECDLERLKNANTLNKLTLQIPPGRDPFKQAKCLEIALRNLTNVTAVGISSNSYEDTMNQYFEALISMQKGLEGLYIDNFLIGRSAGLISSIHASTLQNISITYYLDIDAIQEDLLNFIRGISGTLQVLHLESFHRTLSSSFMRELFNILKTCEKLVVLRIEGVPDPYVFADAISLASLPDFALLQVKVNCKEVAEELQLCRLMNEHRVCNLPSEFKRRIQVEYDLPEEEDDYIAYEDIEWIPVHANDFKGGVYNPNVEDIDE